MGTRADFYVASGDDPMDLQLEYLGSISSDGREIGNVEEATTEKEFRLRVLDLLDMRGGRCFSRINSLRTDVVFVWVPGHGIVYRMRDETERSPFKEVDDGAGIYISLAIENQWHAKAIESRDPETGDYTIPEWDDYSGFEAVSRIEGIRYRYPDNRNAA